MKRALLVTLFVALGFVAFAANPQLWTCGMHPQIIKHEPGNCPICGMKLTPLRNNAAAGASSDDHAIHIDPATVQRMNLKIAPVRRAEARREIRTFGSVAYNEEGLRDITLKYEGWIEKLFVDTTWTRIKAGDPLFEIYSPDLYNAELNFVIARGSEGETNGPLMRAALGRLQLFDLPKSFLTALAESGKVQRTYVFRAPADGVVIEKSAVVGQMLKPGERVYRTADLSTVWVLAQVYEQDLPFVHPGEPVEVRVTYGSPRTYAGVISLVQPQVDEQTRAATARITLPNPDGALRPGMYIDVRFQALIAAAAVLVPETAVLRSGDHCTVFVAKAAGAFEPREVTLGARTSTGDYQVLEGLKAGDAVVTSGQFMLDSESQLREAIEKMSADEAVGPQALNAPQPTPSAQMAAPPSSSSDATSASPSQQLGQSAVPEIAALAAATADAAAALAADDFDAYDKALAPVNQALRAWLALEGRAGTPLTAAALVALPQAIDLKTAREVFEPFSTAVTDLARRAGVVHGAGLHAFECPMAPSTGKARWLQRSGEIKNPFFGTAMPNCGEELNR